MSDETAILSLPYILPAQAQKHVTHNTALQALDLAVQLAVTDRGSPTPPAGPAEGARHIVGPGASGDWAGQDHAIALFTGAEGWLFTTPLPGWRAWVAAEQAMVVWDGTGWISLAQNLAGLGINTTSDAINRLAVAAQATLLTHEGAGHQLKLNKAGTAETASLLFQTNWSGRAEMGTLGSDAFAIKLSADGSTWITALGFDATSGTASGQAVQQSPEDVTTGRLMRADYGYGPGNLLGTVSESGGLPTGAVIESGSNANGDYIRFADGTQICARQHFDILYSNGSACTSDWVYPAGFVSVPSVSGVVNASTTLSSATPPLDALGAVSWANSGSNASTARLNVRRVPGAADFVPGDKVVVLLTAVGRWF